MTANGSVRVNCRWLLGGSVGRLWWGAWLYITAVVVAAVAVTALGPYTGVEWAPVVALGLLQIVSESTATVLRSRSVAWSATSIASLAAVVLTGPVGAALVSCCTLLGIRRGPSPPQRLFNTAMYALSAYLAGHAFLLSGGHVGTPEPSSFPGIIGPFVVADVAHVVINFALLGGVLWLTREPGAGSRVDLHLKLGITDLGYGAFGLLTAALWKVLGPFAPVLLLIPLLAARWAVAQFAAQQRAQAATVSALCQAVETKDVYTRGHSERVSRGSVMIAREIGMRTERVEAIRYAGMLHDVGKLGVPTSVLQKSGSLTDEEYAAIQLHPMCGLDIVRDIGFLDEALAGIMHHHERIDGRGYPMGLAGDEIPEFARVLAVADAFDAMTSTRSYRGARPVPEAVAELRKWAGRQFDPAFVDAFIAAIERDGWKTPEPPAAGDDAADVVASAVGEAGVTGPSESAGAIDSAIDFPAIESM
ncbi:MAG: HD-GYP domain-containing protein [Nocardiopsaceae bacterium]|nr:HD-GYP domain-containing protein [Nocardiopsaceae bacterium]